MENRTVDGTRASRRGHSEGVMRSSMSGSSLKWYSRTWALLPGPWAWQACLPLGRGLMSNHALYRVRGHPSTMIGAPTPLEGPRVTLDQASFRALASEVRIEVLKKLDERRMTVTDLAGALSLSKPTLLEHLEKLQQADLVKRLDEGRKWIYYELTGRGKKILHPERVTIVVSLCLSFLLAAAGAFALFSGLATGAVYGPAAGPDTMAQGQSFSSGAPTLSPALLACLGL